MTKPFVPQALAEQARALMTNPGVQVESGPHGG
jgi:hypothetical protein